MVQPPGFVKEREKCPEVSLVALPRGAAVSVLTLADSYRVTPDPEMEEPPALTVPEREVTEPGRLQPDGGMMWDDVGMLPPPVQAERIQTVRPIQRGGHARRVIASFSMEIMCFLLNASVELL